MKFLLNKKTYLSITLLISFGFLFSCYFGPVFYQNLSVSAPIGIYCRSYLSPKTEDYVITRLPQEITGLNVKDDTLLIKKIVASQGALYEVNFQEMTINNNKYPISQEKKLPHLKNGKFSVPENKVMLINDSPISFDSRYFGPVDQNNIIGKIFLLIDYEAINNYFKEISLCIKNKL